MNARPTAMQVIQQLEAMSPERFLAIYEALAREGFGPLDDKVAAALKFRPVAIRRLAMEKRAETARKLLVRGRQADLCYELFGSYLVTKAKDLVAEFLDGTGVPHKECMVEDVEAAKPDPAKLAEVLQALDAKYDPADVTLYLALAAQQWPSVPEVETAWRMRS
ncbi:MAG: hypothetical protein R3F49_11525 [Planctomycetota bacterium]